MRTTANIAAVKGFDFTGLAHAARIAKNIVLFAAAPFIGLAYAAAFPFVAVGTLGWFAVRAARKRAGAA